MNDFETVRESIYGPGSKRGFAALDRIEAEVERLRDGPMARVNAELRALCVEAYAALAVRGNSNDLTDRLRDAALAKEEA